MGPNPADTADQDLFRAELVNLIDQRHELVRLAALIDWDAFNQQWSPQFVSTTIGCCPVSTSCRCCRHWRSHRNPLRSEHMTLDRDAIKATVRGKVIALARLLGMDAGAIGDDEIILATGLLDSTAVLELVVWFEQTYELPLAQDEINIDNLGSINAMTEFLLARKAGGAVA